LIESFVATWIWTTEWLFTRVNTKVGFQIEVETEFF